MGKPRRRYSHAEVIATTQAFLAQHGRMPTKEETGVEYNLPHYKTILLMFGNWEDFTRHVTGKSPVLRQRKCLKCEHSFPSEGPENRICPQCKNTDEWRETSDWLAGKTMTRQQLFGGRRLMQYPEALKEDFGHHGFSIISPEGNSDV